MGRSPCEAQNYCKCSVTISLSYLVLSLAHIFRTACLAVFPGFSFIHWIIEKAREFQKNIYFCFIDCAKAFDCVDHNKLWKILKVMGIPDHLTCLLRNLCAGQEETELDMEQ